MIAYSDLDALGLSVQVIPKRYAAGKRIFVDFADEQISKMLEVLESGIVTTEPQNQTIHDVRLVPLQRTAAAAGNVFVGGLFKDDKFLDEFALRRGRGRAQTSHVRPPAGIGSSRSETRYQKIGTAWFGGYLFNKYGHFLLESLTRVLDREVIDGRDSIIFFTAVGMKGKLPRFANDIFDLLGIDLKRILLCDVPMEVGSLKVLDLTFQIRDFVNVNNRKHLQSYPAPAVMSGPLYLSRSKLDAKRKVFDERGLETMLTDSGIASVMHPQLMPVCEQLGRMSSARIVSGCEGSAFHSLVFLSGSRTSLMFCGTPANRNYILCDEIIEGDAIYVNCDAVVGVPATRSAWTVDATKVFQILKAAS